MLTHWSCSLSGLHLDAVCVVMSHFLSVCARADHGCVRADLGYVRAHVEWVAAEAREDAVGTVAEAKRAVDAEDWQAAREACREALQLVVLAGMPDELNQLQELEHMVREGEAKSREKEEGERLVAKAHDAVGRGDFEGAREAVRDARGAFKRAAWHLGEDQIAELLKAVEVGERRLLRHREGHNALHLAKVFPGHPTLPSLPRYIAFLPRHSDFWRPYHALLACLPSSAKFVPLPFSLFPLHIGIPRGAFHPSSSGATGVET